MPEDKPISNVSLLNKRIIRSRRRELNVGILFCASTIAFTMAIALYTIRVEIPRQEKVARQAYRDTTLQLSNRLSAGVAKLSEWSTDESLESYSKALFVLGERDEVDASLVGELNERVDSLKEARRNRQMRFESLIGDVDDFPLVSSVDDVLAFDRRMRAAIYTLSKKQGEDLMNRWANRRENVIAIRDGKR